MILNNFGYFYPNGPSHTDGHSMNDHEHTENDKNHKTAEEN